MTHQFHPLCGQDFEFVAYRQNWGEDRVHLHDENGQLFSLQAGWTDVAAADPFVVIAAGRCPFTTDGLLALADLADRLWAQCCSPTSPSPAPGTPSPRTPASQAASTAPSPCQSPEPAWKIRQTKASTIAEIDKLLDHHTCAEIAAILHRRGLPNGEGQPFTPPWCSASSAPASYPAAASDCSTPA